MAGLEEFIKFCKRLGGHLQKKSYEEAVCYIPEDVSIVAIEKKGDRIDVGVTRGYGVKPLELHGVDELIVYDVEKVTLDEIESIEFSEKPRRFLAEILPNGRLRIFVD